MYPEIINVYSKAGRGQGQGVASPRKGFLATVRHLVRTVGAPYPAWLRLAPGTSNSWEDAQVDVTAIPGVRPLRKDGKWASYPN